MTPPIVATADPVRRAAPRSRDPSRTSDESCAQARAGSSSVSTRSNSVHAQTGQVHPVNASALAASSVEDQVALWSKLPHLSHFLINAMGLPPEQWVQPTVERRSRQWRYEIDRRCCRRLSMGCQYRSADCWSLAPYAGSVPLRAMPLPVLVPDSR